jgi:hypothetical protein
VFRLHLKQLQTIRYRRLFHIIFHNEGTSCGPQSVVLASVVFSGSKVKSFITKCVYTWPSLHDGEDGILLFMCNNTCLFQSGGDLSSHSSRLSSVSSTARSDTSTNLTKGGSENGEVDYKKVSLNSTPGCWIQNSSSVLEKLVICHWLPRENMYLSVHILDILHLILFNSLLQKLAVCLTSLYDHGS